MTTFTQLYTRPKIFLRGWLLVLGLEEGLVECATLCVKSWVILLDLLGLFKKCVKEYKVNVILLMRRKMGYALRLCHERVLKKLRRHKAVKRYFKVIPRSLFYTFTCSYLWILDIYDIYAGFWILDKSGMVLTLKRQGLMVH